MRRTLPALRCVETMTLGGRPVPTLVSVPGDEIVGGYLLTSHAAGQARRRGIELERVREVLLSPEQRVDVRPGRVVLQSRYSLGTPPRMYLLRAVVDTDRFPLEVVTVYRTSRVDRYWRSDS